MRVLERMRAGFLAGVMVMLAQTTTAGARQDGGRAAAAGSQEAVAERGGQHDFDFAIGTWKTHLSRLDHPLTGSKTWIEYEGTSVVRKVWDGRANLLELEADGQAGHLEAMSLRLYNPESHQWSLNFSNSSGGTL